jgi:hypothetical protein
MIETNIWGAFQESEFHFDVSTEPYRILFDEEKRWRTSAFQELWTVNFPLEKLSPRRQAAKFEWINQLE